MDDTYIIAILSLAGVIFTGLLAYVSNQKTKKLEKTLDAKKEAYDEFLKSLSNYLFSNDGIIISEFQASRFRLLLYSSDETIREFLRAMPDDSKINYNINDPVSIILYAIRNANNKA